MGILAAIKEDVKKSGQSKGKIFYVREGQKARIRFLQDMDDGYEFTFHNKYNSGINCLCRETFDQPCPYCDSEDEEIRTNSNYCWSVWDYEAKEVKLFLFKVSSCSPLAALMALYESYGTITDRDYIIGVTGKGIAKTYSVVPMDKVKFRNSKAKPYSYEQALKLIEKAYPFEGGDDEGSGNSPRMHGDGSGDVQGDDEGKYSRMAPKELYKACREREIECEPKKPARYYVNLLIEDDQAMDDWGDEEGEEEGDDYDNDESDDGWD